MSFAAKWGREKRYFPIPPPDTPLSAIRALLADYTQLPLNSFKLIHAGAVMKDDAAPISAYGIKPNSTIAIIGTGETHAPSSKASPSPATPDKIPRTEAAVISQIHSELDRVRQKLLPDVDIFLHSIFPSATNIKIPPGAKTIQQPDWEHEHARLGELLLQSLLRLDAIHSEGEWEQARKERKGAVKEVQALLDRLDGGWRSRAKAS